MKPVAHRQSYQWRRKILIHEGGDPTAALSAREMKGVFTDESTGENSS